MKKIKFYIILLTALPMLVSSCLKEDYIPYPTVDSVKMFMTAVDGKDSLITEVRSGKTIKFVVESEAEVCTVWPGGIRRIMKQKGTAIDSIDMFNHPVLIASDCFSDYGLVGARGLKCTQVTGGWAASYKYPNPGDFDLTVVITNHGYMSTDYRQVIVPYGKIAVK